MELKSKWFLTLKTNKNYCNLPKYERPVISQLRLGILPLRIETGQYSNLSVENRICLLHDSGHVENESHFLFQCKHI